MTAFINFLITFSNDAIVLKNNKIEIVSQDEIFSVFQGLEKIFKKIKNIQGPLNEEIVDYTMKV